MTKIIGNTTATPNPKPDWNQTDKTKADYINNKPDITKSEGAYSFVQKQGEGGTMGSTKRKEQSKAPGKNAAALGVECISSGDCSFTANYGAKALEKGSTAFGNSTAGRTPEEWANYYWDVANWQPQTIKERNKQGSVELVSGELPENWKELGIVKKPNTNEYYYVLSSGSDRYAPNADFNPAFAEGQATKSKGFATHTQGYGTIADADFADASGQSTTSHAHHGHAGGFGTTNNSPYGFVHGASLNSSPEINGQTIFGTWNVINSNAQFIIATGRDTNTRSNAFEVLKDGRAKVQTAPKEDNDVVRKIDLAGFSGGGVDIHINGKSIVQNGIANIPIAKQGTVGLVTTAGYGLTINANNGNITLQWATDANITQKKQYTVLGADDVDLILKTGLTTNTLTLTEEEQANACGWLGAVKKVAKDKKVLVYTNDDIEDTAQTHYLANDKDSYKPYAIPMIYGAAAGKAAVGGYLLTADPVNNYHAANKQYVDNAISNAVITGGGVDVQINGTSIVQDGVANIPYGDGTFAGVAKFAQAYGLTTMYAGDGIVSIHPATNEVIDARTGTKGHTNPIVPENLDYALVSGVTKNSLTLTDEEKTNACNWLGALQKITEKRTGDNALRVYGVLPSGEQITLYATTDTTSCAPNWITRYSSNTVGSTVPTHTGVILTNIPTLDYQAANKKYVDDSIAGIEVPSGSSLDVQINGTSIVENGVANIPLDTKVDKQIPTGDSLYAATKSQGDILIRVVNTDNGIAIYNNKDLGILPASETEIANKKLARKPICTSKLDYAVKVGLTTNTLTLTDTEKANACKWLGAASGMSLTMYSTDVAWECSFVDEFSGFISINIIKRENIVKVPYIGKFTIWAYDEENDEETEETHIGIYLDDIGVPISDNINDVVATTLMSCGGVSNQAFLSTSEKSSMGGNHYAFDQITFMAYGEWITRSLDEVFYNLYWYDEWGNPIDKIPFYNW